MGPLILQRKRQGHQLVTQAVEQEPSLLLTAKPCCSGYESGFFFGGTLFDKVTPDMDIYQQEVFGPVLVVVRVSSLEEAVSLINQHEYGNVAYLPEMGKQAVLSDQVMVGMVGINVLCQSPFLTIVLAAGSAPCLVTCMLMVRTRFFYTDVKPSVKVASGEQKMEPYFPSQVCNL